jgi:hypothetical protein
MLSDPSVATKSWHMACVSGLGDRRVGARPLGGNGFSRRVQRYVSAPRSMFCGCAFTVRRSERVVEGATLGH